jgi:hypothetical protein
MKRSIGLVAPALFVLVAFSSHAATITNTYYVTATGFQARLKACDPPAPAPVDPVTVAFSISFDNGIGFIFDSAANVTLISLNMPNSGSLLYSYSPTVLDELTVGDGIGSNTVTTGADNFHVSVGDISTSPIFGGLTYTVSSPANAAKCVFDASSGTVSVGPPWTHVPFPVTGIRLGQTIKVNVVEGPVPIPGPGPCEALLNIYDASNKLVASQRVTPPGSVAFDYSLRSAIGAGRPVTRKEFRPEVILMPNTPAAGGPATGACQALASAEVYDDLTKSTSLIVPEKNPGPGGLPAEQFGPVGVGFLQTVRLNVAAFPPNPCVGTFSFTDVQGNALRAPSPVRLTAGQSTFVDLPGTSVPSDSGHGEVMAAFTPAPGAAPGTCVPSVEVYDQLTGGTQAIISSEANPGPIN